MYYEVMIEIKKNKGGRAKMVSATFDTLKEAYQFCNSYCRWMKAYNRKRRVISVEIDGITFNRGYVTWKLAPNGNGNRISVQNMLWDED